jgi:hypothetical protein
VLDGLPAATVPLAVLALIGAAAALAAGQLVAVSPRRRVILDRARFGDLLHPGSVDARAAPSMPGAEWRVDFAAASGIGAMGLACLMWAFAGHSGHKINLLGVSPADFLTYGSWLLIAAMCTFLGRFPGRRSWARSWPSAITVIAAGLCLVYCAGLLQANFGTARDKANADALSQLEQTLPAEAASQTAYRVGMASDQVDQWVDLQHNAPLARGVQSQSIVNLDWQFWIERALWDGTMKQGPRAFTFDWYGVKWMFADNTGDGIEKAYASDPSDYQLVRTPSTADIPVYQNAHARPIGVATNATTALVIGDPEEYGLVFRALSFSDADSSRIVPIQGGPWVDTLSAQQLDRYDAVVLYGARAHSWSRAGRLLDQYVRQGGRLVIEQADSPVPARLPSVYPVSGLARRAVIGGNWGFTSRGSPLLDHFNLASFSPPQWGHLFTWDVMGAQAVAPWARPVLSIGQQTVVAEGQLGRGHVYYSGLNLPFHVASFSNGAESSLLAAMISPDVRASSATASLTSVPGPLPPSTADAVGPEHEVIRVPAGARGVIYKETYSADWTATVNGRRASVERAGPSFMYVRLPGGGPATVSFTYQQIGVEKAGWAVSGLTAVLLTLFMAGIRPPPVVRRWRDRLLGR